METDNALMRAIEARLSAGSFRKEVLQMLDDNCDCVLEFGYGDGSLLLAAKVFRHAKKIYGIELRKSEVAELFDGAWHCDLSLPGCGLDPSWTGAFDRIISTCALEHVYDPWICLSKLRRYLRPDGKIIVEIPNIQCWESLYRIAAGEFPYTTGAHFDSTHIRWYTVHSFAELLEFVGFELESVTPLTYGADLGFLNRLKELKTVTLPPPGVRSSAPPIVLKFPVDVKAIYPFFVAPRFIVTARRGEAPLRDRSLDGREFEEFRLRHRSKLRLMEKIIPDPMNLLMARELSDKLKRDIPEVL
jgi:SAM-dependent methyltransferase